METDQNYSVEDFISRVKDLDLPQMIKETRVASAVDTFNFSQVKLNFANRLNGFLWFLEHRTLLTDTLNCDIALFKQVADILVEKKQMSEDVLHVFGGKL